MKIISIAAAAIAMGALAMVATPAHADAGEDHPGSCLVVRNRSGVPVTISLNYPTLAGTWDYQPDETPTVLADEGKQVLTSPTGKWDVHLDHDGTNTWDYDGQQNASQGCNGSWTLTVN